MPNQIFYTCEVKELITMESLQICQHSMRNQQLTKLEILRELDKRKALPEDLENERIRLDMGNQGEQKVLSYIQQFGCEHWQVIPNLWLDYFGKFECDLLLLTTAGIYPFEIKNYTGKFEFRKSQCLINGKKIGHNAIAQAQKVYINIKSILDGASIPVNLQGAVIFIGSHNEVVIHDSIEDIDIVRSTQLRNYIWKIAQEERSYHGAPIDFQKIIQALNIFKTENPFGQDNIPENIKARVHKGILCSHCGSFNLKTNLSYISCKCGMHEPRENAIVRTICEYGVIHHNKDLTIAELVEFFDGDISRSTIRKYLKKHFAQVGNSRSIKYINKILPFNSLQKEFQLTNHRKLEIFHY